MNDFQQYIHKSRYARYIPELGRRETWEETVKRYVDNVVVPVLMPAVEAGDLGSGLIQEIQDSITKMEVLPSMRALMTAGEALNRDNIAAYNVVNLELHSTETGHGINYGQKLLQATHVGFLV